MQWPRYSSRERSERSYKRVPRSSRALLARRRAAARRDYVRGCSLKSSRAPPTTARCRRRSCGVAHSFSDVRQTASVSTTEAAAYISGAAYMSRAYLHSSVQLSLLFSSPTMTTYTNATSVCPRLYATRTYKRRRRRHTYCHIHIRTYIVATRQVSTAVIR